MATKTFVSKNLMVLGWQSGEEGLRKNVFLVFGIHQECTAVVVCSIGGTTVLQESQLYKSEWQEQVFAYLVWQK